VTIAPDPLHILCIAWTKQLVSLDAIASKGRTSAILAFTVSSLTLVNLSVVTDGSPESDGPQSSSSKRQNWWPFLVNWSPTVTTSTSHSWWCSCKFSHKKLHFYLGRFAPTLHASFLVTPLSIHTYDLDLLPQTLETFPAMPAHMTNIYTKFYWIPLLSADSAMQNRAAFSNINQGWLCIHHYIHCMNVHYATRSKPEFSNCSLTTGGWAADIVMLNQYDSIRKNSTIAKNLQVPILQETISKN